MHSCMHACMYRLKDISLSGVLPLKTHSVSATSRYPGKQDSQEQSTIVNKYVAQKLDEVIRKGQFDLSSFEGLEDFYTYLRGHLSLVDIMTERSSSEKTAGAFHYFHLANNLILDFFSLNWGPYKLTETNGHASELVVGLRIGHSLVFN